SIDTILANAEQKNKNISAGFKKIRINFNQLIRIPQGIFFSKYHTWAHLQANGNAKVGIDDLLLHIAGNVKIDSIKTPGEIIRKGDLLTKINHNEKILNVFSPVSGEITATNTMMTDNPEQI